MNIGLVRRGFSRTGGAESYVKRFGRVLAEGGHRVTLYSTQDWPQAEWQYGTLVRLKPSSPLHFAQSLQERRKPDETLFSLDRVLQCDCYRAGDGLHKLWLQRRVRHERPWRARFRFLNRKHRELLELELSLFQSGGARHVIANSQLVKSEIVNEFAYPEDRITVIYNGLPSAHFKRKPGTRLDMRRDWDLRENDIALLFAGSGWERKGLKYAIQAISSIANRNLLLLVAGKGEKPVFRSNKIRFLGPVADMQSLYAAADLFILPTVYDPFSNACLEALSYGMPVITTATNGFSEIIEPEVHGEIIRRAEDVEALQEAIKKWIHADRRESAREKCAERAGHFSMEKNVEQTLQVLANLGDNR
jgi:UDP-glucose:(heptosyl)LPS alpha-1,3-glucosyltransferase